MGITGKTPPALQWLTFERQKKSPRMSLAKNLGKSRHSAEITLIDRWMRVCPATLRLRSFKPAAPEQVRFLRWGISCHTGHLRVLLSLREFLWPRRQLDNSKNGRVFSARHEWTLGYAGAIFISNLAPTYLSVYRVFAGVSGRNTATSASEKGGRCPWETNEGCRF